MNARPHGLDWRNAAPGAGTSLQQGNRVLESIAQQEAFRSLLAFSDLREHIRSQQSPVGEASDQDLFETERFILDEVLQLITDRALSITPADGIVVALVEGSCFVCRASGGDLRVERGSELAGKSALFLECTQSSRIVRSDDCKNDNRALLDISQKLNARSTVLIPLRGQHEQLGMLQAFSKQPRAFTEKDERSLDLFGELVLSALKPQDQDRRIGWLSGVADEVLHGKRPTESEPPNDSSEPAKAEIDESAKPVGETAPSITQPPALAYRLPLAGNSRPGLGVVMGLVTAAAIFSAVIYSTMQFNSRTALTKVAWTHSLDAGPAGTTKPAATAAPTTELSSNQTANSASTPAEEVLSLQLDNLLSSDPSSGNRPDPSALPGSKSSSKITSIRHWASALGSTVVVDMEDSVPYEVHRLASPERIYFDLHGTALAADLNGKTLDIGDTLLSRLRIGQPASGVTRIVLDTKDAANFSVSMESSPYRLVVELRGGGRSLLSSRGDAASAQANHEDLPQRSTLLASAPQLAKSAPATAPALYQATPQAALSAKSFAQPLPAKSERMRIVLDAGHGGWDLGTVGRQGLLEKDLVLDVTQRLGKLLETRLGSEVIFTRTGDTYLPLDQRADLANQGQADLFVSVHANYSTSSSARGVETYYTNLFSAPGLREIEQHEDGTFAQFTPIVLSAEGLHVKIEESRRLAASVQRSLYATLGSNSPDIRNRGIKDAAFAVLTGTTMPSILTEISFVSSPADERNLQSAAYRQQIAEALYRGIAHYQQSTSPRQKFAQLQAGPTHR